MKRIKNTEFYQLVSKNYFWLKIILVVFSVSFLGGLMIFFLPQFNFLGSILNDSLNQLSELALKAKNLNFFGKFWLIFENNLIVVLIMMLGGVFLGFLPILAVLLNGLLLGFVLSAVFSAGFDNFELLVLILTLLPHAIVELFTICLAASFGLRLGVEYLNPKIEKNRVNVFKSAFKDSFKAFPYIVILLAAAALIEVFDIIIGELLIG